MSNPKDSPDLPDVRTFDGHDWFSTKTYRRNLPHWELKGSTYFITTRVESNVDKPFLNPEVAQLMVSILCRDDKKKYLLHAYVVMPDHLHFIIKPISNNSLAQIIKNLKGASPYSINKLLNRSGKFWQTEAFDHLIRNNVSMCQKWEYIRQNPVKARLCKTAEEYPYSSFFESKSEMNK